MVGDIAVYRLTPITGDPRYEGFGTFDEASFRTGEPLSSNFLPERIHSRGWQAPRLTSVWKPVRVRGRVRKYNDYPCLNLVIPAFSRRAVDALHALLEPNGELLPLHSELGDYYAFNITTVADVLDAERSEIRWNVKPILASRVERVEFFPDRIGPLSIFQLPELPGQAMVTERFVSAVREHGLKGFDFSKLWPLPPAVRSHELSQTKSRRQETAELPGSQTLKGNTLVIRLKLESGRRGSGPERRRIDRLMHKLDSVLVDPNSESPPRGTLEGHDYGATGECRIFLTCPDADALAETLRPWLEQLVWPAGFVVVKRYGEFTDQDAREVPVDMNGMGQWGRI